jgi:mRNA-degrading endonuclease YafQ of YafQ-DinJ toxin-antitoxin module
MKRVTLEIHQTRRFGKQLQAMYKAGKNERIVAGRAERILADLQADPLHEETECRRTHYGEHRLRDCRKYDLSCGFRLIGLKRDRRLIFTCVGSHDDCQRWIENNREHQEEIESIPVPVPCSENRPGILPLMAEAEIDEYEEELMARIDEQILREIFAGFYKNIKPNTGEIT